MSTLNSLSTLSSPLGLYSALSAASSSLATTTAIGNAAGQNNHDQTVISSYGQLLSSLSNFMYALQQFAYGDSTMNTVSSNSAVATASAYSYAQKGVYQVSVSSLAQSQAVKSTTFASASTVIGSGTLSIQTGTYNSGSNTFASDGSSPTSISISNGTLSSIASAINSAGAGINASVVQDSGGYRLLFTGTKTGSTANYSITVSGDGDGNNTDNAGLSQLAYDPTGSSGSGKNMILAQSGADAAYSVNGTSATSSSNTGITLASSVSASLLSTGSTTISVGVDQNTLSTNVQSLATAFNSLRADINNLLIPGGALEYDAVTGQLANSLNATALNTYSNNSSTLITLNQIGLQFQQPQSAGQVGMLTVNSNSLNFAYNLDQTGAANLLTLASQSFIDLSRNYAGAGHGILPASVTALQKQVISNNTLIGYASSNTFNLATLIDQMNRGTSIQSSRLTGTQIAALNQYANVLALSQPFSVQAQLVGYLGQLGSSGFSAVA